MFTVTVAYLCLKVYWTAVISLWLIRQWASSHKHPGTYSFLGLEVSARSLQVTKADELWKLIVQLVQDPALHILMLQSHKQTSFHWVLVNLMTLNRPTWLKNIGVRVKPGAQRFSSEFTEQCSTVTQELSYKNMTQKQTVGAQVLVCFFHMWRNQFCVTRRARQTKVEICTNTVDFCTRLF